MATKLEHFLNGFDFIANTSDGKYLLQPDDCLYLSKVLKAGHALADDVGFYCVEETPLTWPTLRKRVTKYEAAVVGNEDE